MDWLTDGSADELALHFIPLFIEATECAHDLTFFPHISEDICECKCIALQWLMIE
jgi:hypothetical protein